MRSTRLPIRKYKLNDAEIEFLVPNHLFLDPLLMNIRGKTISYSTYKKKMQKETQINLENENLEQNNGSIEKSAENVSNLNQIVGNEKKKSTKSKSRKTQSSAKIDVVNLDSEKNKIKKKKTGWWNN